MSAFGEPRGEISLVPPESSLRIPQPPVRKTPENIPPPPIPSSPEMEKDVMPPVDSKQNNPASDSEKKLIATFTPKELSEFREAGSVEELTRREEKRKKRGGLWASLLRLLLGRFFVQKKEGDTPGQDTEQGADEFDQTSSVLSPNGEEQHAT